MQFLKNLPETPEFLSELIQGHPGQVVSMSLSKSEHFQMTLFAFAAGENISEEAYTGDTFYYILDGEAPLWIHGDIYHLTKGGCMAIPAGTLHAIGGDGPFKMLQITLYQS